MWLTVRDVYTQLTPEHLAALQEKYPNGYEDVLQAYVEYASLILGELSGGKYTAPHVTEETLPRYATGSVISAYPSLYSMGELCADVIRFKPHCVPVREVLTASIGGVVLDPRCVCIEDTYTITVSSPQSLSGDPVHMGCDACVTFTYVCGTGIPASGTLAARKLATEMLGAHLNLPCSIPERVTSVSRQGVSWTMIDPQEFLTDGRTGLYEVDLFLRAVNPRRALRPSRVFIPGSSRKCNCVGGCGC